MLERLLECRLVPALGGGDGNGDELGAGVADCFDGVWIAGRLDDRAVAAGEQCVG